jgi:hypothetical protein
MTRRELIILFLLGLAVPLAIAQFQSLPGYMDADYYFGGGIQLVKGNGFTEPYLWNYLNDPQGLPTPSHAYWMPLASLLSAFGMWLTRQTTFASARFGFILLTAFIPPLTGLFSFRLTSNRTLAFLSGLLACFPIYYAPFLPVTDNYAIYMILGLSFFVLLSLLPTSDNPLLIFLGFGLISALMTLARSDGLLWLGISILIALWYAPQSSRSTSFLTANSSSGLYRSGFLQFVFRFLHFSFFTLIGFLLFIFPWYIRNLSAFGSLMAPGGSYTLWLTDYNDTFTYPASQLTMQSWLASGWAAVLQARLGALKLNLLNAFAAQGGIFLFPLILIGIWRLRKDVRVRFAVLVWVLLLGVMTFIFPFAGARGAFFHAGSALQPVWWAVAPIGLDAIITSMRRRGWFDDRAFVIFRASLVGIAILMTTVIFITRVLPGWEREDGHYTGVENLLAQHAPDDEVIVIVRNPPGYYVATGRAAIAIPAGGIPSILEVSARYQAYYLILELEGTSEELRALYDDPYQSPLFHYLGESDGNRLFEIIQ